VRLEGIEPSFAFQTNPICLRHFLTRIITSNSPAS
jgi:hypothetical protein